MERNIYTSAVAEAPKYLQVKQYLIEKIESGEFKVKSQVPSMNELSRLFDINKNTVVRALNELASEKYIYQKRGLGSFVAPRKKLNKSYNLGILVYNIESPIYSKIIKNIDDNCRKYSYHIISASVNGSYEQEKSIISDFIRGNKVDGLVVFPVNSGDEELRYLKSIVNAGTPVILFNSAGKQEGISTMSFDEYEGIRCSVRHLFENGYKKIGLVTCNSQSYDIMQRFYGYRSGLESCSLPFNEGNVFLVNSPEEQDGYDVADKIIDMPDRPEALVVISDEVAIGIMNRMFERGIEIPKNIAIIGGGNINIGSHPLYSLSTIAPDFAEMGRRISDVLLEQIDMDKIKTCNLFFKQKLIIRKSSLKST